MLILEVISINFFLKYNFFENYTFQFYVKNNIARKDIFFPREYGKLILGTKIVKLGHKICLIISVGT